MRSALFGVTILALVAISSGPVRSYDMPNDPYPWCAFYTGDGGGGTNCGFTTFEQCLTTVSGIGGFCGPNQFYNPQRGGSRARKR